MAKLRTVDRGRPAKLETLRKIDALRPQPLKGLAVLHALSDRLMAEILSQADDRLNNVLACPIGHQVAHKLDVDLQVLDGEVF